MFAINPNATKQKGLKVVVPIYALCIRRVASPYLSSHLFGIIENNANPLIIVIIIIISSVT